MRQIASVHFSPSNDMRRFLQTETTVALGHRFKIYAADSRGGVQCTSHPRIHLLKQITTAIWAWRRLIYPALCWHIAKRGLRRSGSTPSQRDRSARPSQGREGVPCETFCLETSSSRIRGHGRYGLLFFPITSS